MKKPKPIKNLKKVTQLDSAIDALEQHVRDTKLRIAEMKALRPHTGQIHHEKIIYNGRVWDFDNCRNGKSKRKEGMK